MTDGNNFSEEAQKEIERLEAEKAAAEEEARKAKAEADKQRGIADNAEKKFNDWSKEVGEFRKERDALMSKIEDLESKVDPTTGQKGDGSKGKDGDHKPIEKELEELESSMSEDEEKAADSAYEAADEETKKRIRDDKAFRKTFLAAAKETVESITPQSWRSNRDKGADKGKKENKDKEAINALFNQAKRRSTFTPSGPAGGENRPSGKPIKDEDRNKMGPVAQSIFRGA